MAAGDDPPAVRAGVPVGKVTAIEVEATMPINYLLAFIPSSLVPPRTASTPTIPPPGQSPPSAFPGSPATPYDPSESPARDALKQITVVAYDGDGDEIGRESLDAPNAELLLYPPSYADESGAAKSRQG